VRGAYFADNEAKFDNYGGRPIQQKLDHETFKSMEKENEGYYLYRYLVAENA